MGSLNLLWTLNIYNLNILPFITGSWQLQVNRWSIPETAFTIRALVHEQSTMFVQRTYVPMICARVRVTLSASQGFCLRNFPSLRTGACFWSCFERSPVHEAKCVWPLGVCSFYDLVNRRNQEIVLRWLPVRKIWGGLSTSGRELASMFYEL